MGAAQPEEGKTTYREAMRDAPVERVCSAEVPIPYARRLEEAALPQTADIVAAARRAVD
ncbi:hypothetical protein ACFCZ1_05445 [Streptomyces sp. NPDC056224]|uniref:hypothetical protein n=1 Tax=Streptomyces sp. NPDC056224 TaxID=3345750 RepID=UPI0035E17519